MKRKLTIITLLLLAVGFAAVSTTLFINGTIGYSTNKDDWDVYFSAAVVDGVDKSNIVIDSTKKVIDYTTKDLKRINDESILDFEVTNNSTQYDAEVTLSCNLTSNDIVDLTITPTNMTVPAQTVETGSVTVKLKKVFTTEQEISFQCTLDVVGTSRTEGADKVVGESNYSAAGYIKRNSYYYLTNANLVVFSDTPHYITTDENGYFYVDNLERGYHEMYYVQNKTIEQLQEMTKEEIEAAATEKTNFTTGLTKNISSQKMNTFEIQNLQIGDADEAVLRLSRYDDKFAFRSNTYREKIKTITFKNNLDIPDNKIEEWDIGKNPGKYKAYILTNETDNTMYDLYICGEEEIVANSNMQYYFYRLMKLDAINNIELLNVSNTTSMYGMFSYTGYNSTNFKLNLGTNFDTSKVINMESMFEYAGSNSPAFTLNLGDKFDTSNVTNMQRMFGNTGESSNVFTLDLGDKFDTSKVTDMSYMFIYTGRYCPVFTLNLGNKFDTSNVTDMSYMFKETASNSQYFKLDLKDKFDTSNVESMLSMFNKAGRGSPVFTLNLGNKFDTSKVKDMGYMFNYVGYNNQSFTLNLGDKFDTSNVEDMPCMFAYTGYSSTQFTLNLGDKFDTSKVYRMTEMFNSTGLSSPIFTLNLGDKFDTGHVVSMHKMFMNAGYSNPNFTLNLGGKFDTSNVEYMQAMFQNAGSENPAFTLDLGNKFDTSNVTDMSYMFSATGYNSRVFTLNLGDKFDTSKVTDMTNMFNCTGYNSTKLAFTILIKNPNVTDYNNMFMNTAKSSSSNVTVDYTSETKTLVEDMIATKENGKVVIGKLVS